MRPFFVPHRTCIILRLADNKVYSYIQIFKILYDQIQVNIAMYAASSPSKVVRAQFAELVDGSSCAGIGLHLRVLRVRMCMVMRASVPRIGGIGMSVNGMVVDMPVC